METKETQKLNEVQISTSYSAKEYIVRVEIHGIYSITWYHIYETATAAGKAIPNLKEFYKYYDFDLR